MSIFICFPSATLVRKLDAVVNRLNWKSRSEVEAAIVDLALTVAERDLAAGDYDAAYTAARAGLAASRYEERLHRLAIRAAHEQGATGKVRAQQREMRTVLDDDIEPDDHLQAETDALYDEVAGRVAAARRQS